MKHVLVAVLTAALAISALTASAAAQTPGASPTASPSMPPPSPTPWPPPANIGVKSGCTITNPDGSFIPPAERQCTAMVVWAHLSGFTGTYEVERQIQPWNPPPGPFEHVASVPASAIVGGEGRYDETFAFMDAMGTVRCYRVRTVINGETGPYTNPVCESFAGVPGGGPAPLPPDTGSGHAHGSSQNGTVPLAAAAIVVVAVGTAVAVRRRMAH